MRRTVIVLATGMALLLAGCQADEPTGAGSDDPGTIRPALQIATKSGFQFLPPMVKTAPTPSGSFDPDRAMAVRIVCTRATGPACPVLATLSVGNGGLTVDRAGEYYLGQWFVPRAVEAGRDRYLVEVLDEDIVIAEAALWIVTSSRALSNVAASHVGVVRGTTLEIRFRVETGTVGATRIEVTPAAAILSPGEVVHLDVAVRGGGATGGEGVVWSTSAPAVVTVSPDGAVRGTGPGTAQVTATSGGRSASATLTVVALGQPVSASIGRQGGSLEIPVTNGGRLTVTVPAGALEDPALFQIRPAPRTGPEAARFGFTPANQAFSAPILLAYYPPQGTPFARRAFLSWPGVPGRTLVRLIPDASLQRWIAATTVVGDVAAPPPLQALAGLQRADAEGESGELELTVEESITAAEILQGGRDALAWFLDEPTLQTAQMLMRTIDVVAPSPYDPGELLERNAFLEEWRTAVCSAGRAAVDRYAGLAVSDWDIPDFLRETELLMAWAAVAEQTTLTNELLLPFDGCPGGQPPFRQRIAEKADAFAPRIEALVNPPGRDLGVRFGEVIDTHLRRLIDFTAFLRYVGVESYIPALVSVPREMFGSLRGVAWQSCRVQRNQVRLGRLLELEVGGGGELSAFTDSDLMADLTGCTTALEWRTRPAEAGGGYGSLELTGQLATTGPGRPPAAGSLGLRHGRGLILAGQVQPLECPGNPAGSSSRMNEEQLAVRVRYGLRIETLATRPAPSSLGMTYLQSDSIVVTEEQLEQAIGEDEWGEVELSVWRTGLNCTDIFSTLPAESRLATLTVTQEAIRVEVSPAQVTVAPDGQAAFTATVTNSAQGVSWEASGGTFTTSGNTLTYTAGASEGTYLVIARSLEAPTEAADTAEVTIEAGCPAPGAPRPAGMALSNGSCVGVTITPSSTTVARGGTRQFAAVVSGATNQTVTWTASRGTITGGGLFTAPTSDGPVTITATSVEDPTVFATATATVRAFGGLVISPAGAALGFGQTRLFSVVAGAGPYSWITDSQAGSISSAGIFTAGSTEGEFFVGVSSPTGSAQARVIVDRWAGIYDGAVIRNAAGSNRTWSVGRYFNHPSSGRCTNSTLPCYFTGAIDFGSVALDACYFQPITPGLDAVQGSCDYSGSVFPLGLSGVLTNTSLALEARSGDGTIVILFAMDKR